MRFAGCAAKGATLTSKSRERPVELLVTGPAAAWHDVCSIARCGPHGRRFRRAAPHGASEFDRCENDHVVDTLRRVVAAVAVGSRQLVHTRWIHPPAACTR